MSKSNYNKREECYVKIWDFESGNGYRWRLKAGNGEIVATGQEYTTKDAAKQGCDAVQRAAADAEIIEL